MNDPEWQAAYNAGAGDTRALREALEDCLAYMTGIISGIKQRDGIIDDARAALSK